MVALPNRIVIGELNAPLLTFENDHIKEVREETAVSLIGDELFIDQFVPIVNYQVYLHGIFIPSNYGRFLTADSKPFAPVYNYDLRKLPYGTKITFYNSDEIRGEYFVDTVERTGKAEYKINALSAIGLMNRQRHNGGVYTGQAISNVIAEILGSGYNYEISEEVQKLRVYGWLPRTTKRRNLYQLIMAYGINIIRSSNGGMLFTFLTETEPVEIPQNRLFSGGNVKYDAPASRVEVLEHAYQYLASEPEETLFDNLTSGSADESIITFDHPVYADSIHVTEGNMRITSKGTNYAVVRGNGVLMGVPYVHTTRLIAVDNSDAVNEKVVKVEEATLINLFNSDNVVKRLAQYYFNATTVHGDIVNEGERCGRRYGLTNAFYEHEVGFMSKMSTLASSFMRSSCDFIAGYTPIGQGSAFNNVVVLSGNGTWTVPRAAKEKDVPVIRVVCIGQGKKGGAGSAGEHGYQSTNSRGGEGGEGGEGGVGGMGGDVYIGAVVDISNVNSISYNTTGSNAVFSGGGVTYSSASGSSLYGGFLEVFTGVVYAPQGYKGMSGEHGGNGGVYTPTITNDQDASDGKSITYKGKTYLGGKASPPQIDKASLGWDGTHMYGGGGGGGGASVGVKGGDAPIGTWAESTGGRGANGGTGDAAVAIYGAGGNGGHGGGGGGGGGLGLMWNFVQNIEETRNRFQGGEGGAGGQGSNGYTGCVIIYW